MPCDEPDFQEQEKEARQMAQMLSTPSSLPCVSLQPLTPIDYWRDCPAPVKSVLCWPSLGLGQWELVLRAGRTLPGGAARAEARPKTKAKETGLWANACPWALTNCLITDDWLMTATVGASENSGPTCSQYRDRDTT